MGKAICIVSLCVLFWSAAIVFGLDTDPNIKSKIAPLTPSTPPPKKVSDTGPDIDPVKLAGEKYSAVPAFRTFGSFASSSYAFAQVWVYTDGGQALIDTEVAYAYPTFYRPTWGEVFDHVARQMKCKWSWDPKFRQFKFDRSDAAPPFGVKLADDWTREDRGLYVWHAPKGQGCGMDIYYFGHYTIDPKDAELAKKVRTHFALRSVADWPNAPTEQQMSMVKVAGADALYLKTDTPRPGAVWRQWSFLLDGHAFLIVSAMPKEREAAMSADVDKMLKTFVMTPAATQPAAKPQK
ncbi:MAG: hypothetical protein JWL69_3955 [Phycisphaerales bacterium]|jgi:hypothetical protein|nr:hypothetical protein [Phycisphaerales bacterium]